MADVTEAAAKVGDMILTALQNTFGMSPDEALTRAQLDAGVSDREVADADMGEVLDYMCTAPGVDPRTHDYLSSVQHNYNTYGNVGQSGSTYTGGGGGGGGGGAGGGGGGGNAQIVQQVTNNYATTEINDNHIDINGEVAGNITIDQDNDHVDVSGDDNAVNTGEGDQSAATGEGSSSALSGTGPAQSNSGEIHDSAIGFGTGDTGNASNNEVDDGSAVSGVGDSSGHNVDVEVEFERGHDREVRDHDERDRDEWSKDERSDRDDWGKDERDSSGYDDFDPVQPVGTTPTYDPYQQSATAEDETSTDGSPTGDEMAAG
jgi:hypothetical protein